MDNRRLQAPPSASLGLLCVTSQTDPSSSSDGLLPLPSPDMHCLPFSLNISHPSLPPRAPGMSLHFPPGPPSPTSLQPLLVTAGPFLTRNWALRIPSPGWEALRASQCPQDDTLGQSDQLLSDLAWPTWPSQAFCSFGYFTAPQMAWLAHLAPVTHNAGKYSNPPEPTELLIFFQDPA